MQTPSNELTKIKEDIAYLKETIENMSVILNRRFIEELHEESENIKNGEYLTEEEFKKSHFIN